MNDFNQTNQLHFEFEEYQTMKTPDFGQMMTQKMETIKAGGFDPHKLMVQKKLTDAGEIDTTPNRSWPEQDTKALEEFCQKYGILGFNCGRMSPIAALAMLKQKMGIVDNTLSERVPYGYQMMGTSPTNKKTLLNG